MAAGEMTQDHAKREIAAIGFDVACGPMDFRPGSVVHLTDYQRAYVMATFDAVQRDLAQNLRPVEREASPIWIEGTGGTLSLAGVTDELRES